MVLRAVAASALIALVFAILAVSKVSVLPPKLERRGIQTAGATTHVLIDFRRSRITDRRTLAGYFGSLSKRADLLAQMMASAPAQKHIGRRAHIPRDQLAAVAPITAAVQSVLTEPGSEQRAREIQLSKKPYRLEIQSRPGSPVIDINAQAPSTAEAERLADAAITGSRDYLRVVAIREGADPESQLRLNQLGRARGGALSPRAELKIAGLTFLVAFALALSALLSLARVRAGQRRAEPEALDRTPRPGAAVSSPRGVTLSAAASPGLASVPWSMPNLRGALALQPMPLGIALRRVATRGGDWPRTTRVLPWMLAAFMAILWLVPFDSIQLTFSLPIDLKFDRLVLPFVAATWGLSLVMGGRDAPRLRLTWIHVAVGAFVVVACLSVILDAESLSRTLELDTSLKKLPLLIAYLSLFVMVASVVRRSEVEPLLKYTLALAVICALGMIWEYRFVYNIFFDWSDKLLPGIFRVGVSESGWDLGGRRVTHGPAAHPLVAATMLSMALPIALLGIMKAERMRGRLMYGLAACLLMVAVLATQRKTGILAPVSAVLTLAYFRRRELLRMAPVAAVLLIAVLIVSPGTIAPVLDQFKPDRLGATTVSDRSSDYDAIRPDVWTHVAFGRGYGSYQPLGHRILDSEVLVRTVEMGVLGFASFLLLGVAVVASARAFITARHPSWGTSALAGAAAAVVFLVVATLFDTMSFPQVPYIFLCFAALVAALVKPPEEG